MIFFTFRNTSQTTSPANTAPDTLTLTWATAYAGGVIPENTAVGTVLATLAATPGNSISYVLVTDPDGKFQITGNQLKLKAALSYATKTSHSFSIKATNNAGQTGVSAYSTTVSQVTTTTTYPTNVGASGPKFFVTGQFMVTPSNATTVKARGINTAVYKGDTTEFTLEQWITAMASAGLRTIRQPRGAYLGVYSSSPSTTEPDTGYELEKDDTNLLAFTYVDEPDNINNGVFVLDYPNVTYTPAQLKSLRDTAVAKMGLPAGKTIPWVVNLVGNHLSNYGEGVPIMQDYCQGNEAEWLSQDSYPKQDYGTLFYVRDGVHRTYAGWAAAVQRGYNTGKPQFGYIASSDFSNTGANTPTELRILFWDQVINGCCGIVYFPQTFNPWSWDATKSDLATEMTSIHSTVLALESKIVDTTNGGLRSGTIYTSTTSGSTPGAGQLPHPFTARTIPQSDGSTLYIVLNLSNSAQTLTYAPWNCNGMPFTAGECKQVYTMAYEAPVVDPGPGTGVSARYPQVTRLMPGKSLDPASPLYGDFIVGRTNTTTLRVPNVAQAAITGLTFNHTTKSLVISSAFSNQTLEDWDLDGWLISVSGNGVSNVTVRQNKFTNRQNTRIPVFEMYGTDAENFIFEWNDWLGITTTLNSDREHLSWIRGSTKPYTFRYNYSFYPSNDALKFDGGTVEYNFFFGGGTSIGTHYDPLQTGDLLVDGIIFRYNHVIAEGYDNYSNGVGGDYSKYVSTNILRLVPNNGASLVNASAPIRAYENVFRGGGWQMGLDTWTNIQIYNNWAYDWQWGFINSSGAATATAQVYDNKNLYTGAALTEMNRPAGAVTGTGSAAGTSTATAGSLSTGPGTGSAAGTSTATAVGTSTGGGGSITTVFDSAHLTSAVLSNSDKTATTSSSADYYRAAGMAGTASGKRAVAVSVSGNFSLGLGLSTWPLPGWNGWQNPAVQNDGNVYGCSTAPALGAVSSGDTVYMAYDYTANKIWFRRNSGLWNNNASADPATGVGGLTPSDSMTGALPVVQAENLSTAFTINTSWTLPSGFSGW